MTSMGEGVEVALDFFPARVTLPSGAELNPCRLLVANGRVLVYILRGGEPQLYFDRELVSSEGRASRGFDLLVPDGQVRAVNSRDCGCGNPLRNFNPFPGERKYMVPL